MCERERREREKREGQKQKKRQKRNTLLLLHNDEDCTVSPSTSTTDEGQDFENVEHIVITLVVVAERGVGGRMTGMSTVRERESSLAPSCCASHQDTGGRRVSGTLSNTHARTDVPKRTDTHWCFHVIPWSFYESFIGVANQ